MRVRHVIGSETARLRELRLASLAADPHAFGGTYEDEAARPASWFERWAERSEDGSEQRTYVVVDADDRWLGLALVRADDEAPGDAVINAMWVAPEARGRGASRALCEACVGWASAHDFRAITVAVVVGNDAAQSAYEALGFTASHTITWTGGGRSLEELILTRPTRAGS